METGFPSPSDAEQYQDDDRTVTTRQNNIRNGFASHGFPLWEESMAIPTSQLILPDGKGDGERNCPVKGTHNIAHRCS